MLPLARAASRRRICFWIPGVLCCVLGTRLPAGANPVYVDADAVGAGDGSSWADAFSDLLGGLAAASAGMEIWVAEGTYYPTTGTDRLVSFRLVEGVAIYGGFAGEETSREGRDWKGHPTVLSGDIGAREAPQDNSYHVVVGSGLSPTTVLDGFTITRGYSYFDTIEMNGAGMHLLEASPTLSNLVFSRNAAAWKGGGLYNEASHPTMTHVEFIGNDCWYSGGGIHNEKSDPVLEDVFFTGNRAHDRGGGMGNDASHPRLSHVTFGLRGGGFVSNTSISGAGMANTNGSRPVLTDVLFENGFAETGGGMANHGGNPILTRVTFTGNMAMMEDGGGLYNFGGLVVLQDVVFRDNFTLGSGTGLFNRGSVRLINVLFEGNHSTSNPFLPSGGAGLANYGDAELINVVFLRNQAVQFGGAIFNREGTLTLTNVTCFENRADRSGGAIANHGGTVHLTNSILWGNEAEEGGPEIHQDGGVTRIGYSLVQGSGGSGSAWDPALGTDAGNNLDADPRFVDPEAGNVRLGPGSPAIGAGDDAAVPADVHTDLDGDPRRFGARVDLGPYESQVEDLIPPEISVELSRTCLWPPNRKLETIHAAITVADDTDPEPRWMLTSIMSNEPETGTGGGDLRGDIQDAEIGTDDQDFLLRAERSGRGAGRTYTVSYTAVDASGNTAAAEAEVVVPHARCADGLATPGEAEESDLLLGELPGEAGFTSILPNPFRSSTTLAFHLPEAGAVDLDVFDLRGARVRRLLEASVLGEGVHILPWDGRDEAGRAAAPGVYFVRLRGNGFVRTSRATLIR